MKPRLNFGECFAAFQRCERGVTGVEFAFVAPFIVVYLLATLQLAIIYMAEAYLETVAERAVRIVQTNQANALSQSQFVAQVCGAPTALFDCKNLIVDLGPAPASVAGIPAALPQFDANGNLVNPTRYSIVGPPSKMLMIMMYKWPVVSGPLNFNIGNLKNGNYLMAITQVFQNEPSS